MEDKTDEESRHDFSRNGPLSPRLLIVILLYLVADAGRRGYKHLLDEFWDECVDFGLELPTEQAVSAAAFCKARRKLKPEVCRALLHEVVDGFQKTHGSSYQWNGRRLLACDGSSISLQRSATSQEEFGGSKTGHCPQAMLSSLFDVHAKMMVDLTIAPYASCERKELLKMLDRVRPGDVLLLDRGYTSYGLMKELKDRGIDFVMRASTKRPHKAVGEFIMNQGRDRVIEIAGTRGSSRCAEPVSVRAVYRERRNDDECLVYLTSLHRNEATALEIHELYALRWTVEEHFKVEKGDYLGQRQLHAKSPDGIRQEIIAFALLTAITRSIMADAAEVHEVEPRDVSQKGGYLIVGSYLTRMLADPVTLTECKTVERMLKRIATKLEPPRPGRHYPRRSFKPLPKWGAHGRRWREKSKR